MNRLPRIETLPPVLIAALFALSGGVGLPGTAAAQMHDEGGAGLESVAPWSVPALGSDPGAWPAMSANSPTGFGAAWGDLFVGASYQGRTRQDGPEDGAVGVGFGLGDPHGAVGLQVGVVSYSTFRSGFGERGGVDLHLHRALPAGFSVAVGRERAIAWGEGDSGRSVYAALSRWTRLSARPDAPFSALVLTVGVGNDRFQSERAFRAGEDGVGAFGSAALRVARPLSVIADWTGQDLLLAGSLAPLPGAGLVVTVGVADVTGHAGAGARFVLAGGFRHRFGPAR